MSPSASGVHVSTVLAARVQRLRRDLIAAQEAVDAMPFVLRSRLAASLNTEIARKRDEVIKDLELPLGEGAIHPADAWARLHALDAETSALLEECLLLVTGAAARAPRSAAAGPVDADDWYPILDALVDELVARTPVARWDSFTVPSGTESFRYVSRLIQVRFPRPSIWDAPSVAHELGHYVARTLAEFRNGRMHNLMDELHVEVDGTGSTSWYWVEELFADAFAAYVIGPAYGLTCVTFGFDPLTAEAATDSHPPSSARVTVITEALRLLGDPGVAWLADALETLWTELLVVSEAEPPGPETPPVPELWREKILKLLSGHLTASGYSSWKEAERLSLDFGVGKVGPQTTLSDTANAAWLIRMRAKNRIAVDTAARKAFAVAFAVLRGGTNAQDGTPVAHGDARPPPGRS